MKNYYGRSLHVFKMNKYIERVTNGQCAYQITHGSKCKNPVTGVSSVVVIGPWDYKDHQELNGIVIAFCFIPELDSNWLLQKKTAYLNYKHE